MKPLMSGIQVGIRDINTPINRHVELRVLPFAAFKQQWKGMGWLLCLVENAQLLAELRALK